MQEQPSSINRGAPSAVLSLAILILCVAAMAILKLRLFPDRYLALGYVLPLLLCLWHRDRRLLWAMAAAFAVISALKAFVVLPGHWADEPFELAQWLMQLLNIGVVAVSIHTILNLLERLRGKNEQLERANEELEARGQEIERQNAELQAQSEEMVQQNEELQEQGEELSRQNEELLQQAEALQSQSEDLQHQAREVQMANQEINRRESMLQTLLGSLGTAENERQMLERACQALIDLIGQTGTVAAVLERNGNELILLTQAGAARLTEERRSFANSFAALVVEHDRTSYVDDLRARPDLAVPQPAGCRFRSVLATPLRLGGKPVGVVKIYSLTPQRWSSQHFHVIEWVAAQCAMALNIARLQQELARANARLDKQVQERTAELRDMVDELEYFSYTITHDMRAPLRAIRGFAGALEDQLGNDADPSLKDHLGRISDSARRMDRLITDALSYSQAGKQELALVPVDAGKLLRGIIESYPDFQQPRARISIEGEIPRLLANEAGLTQCFSNLLDNAVKFVAPGREPEVRVRAEVRNGLARLWFQDNGIGISEAFRPRLFQMFQRGSRAYEGTGIGLALVRKVTERMGGQVGVETSSGEGSRFWVELRLDGAARRTEPRDRAGGSAGAAQNEVARDGATGDNRTSGSNLVFRAGTKREF